MPPRGGSYVDPTPVLPYLEDWLHKTAFVDRDHPTAARYLRAMLRGDFRQPSLWRLDELLCLIGRPELLALYYPLEVDDAAA